MASLHIDASTLEIIASRMRQFLINPMKSSTHLTLYPSHALHRVLRFYDLPDWVIKVHIQSPRAMSQRHNKMVLAAQVCEDRGWDRLRVPWGICHTITLPKEKEWTIWIEEKLPLCSPTYQEEWQAQHPACFLPILEQWTCFLLASNCTDVDKRNFPLLDNQLCIALLDLDGLVLADGMWASRALAHRAALIGNTCGSRGLLRCIHPQYIPHVLTWAQPALDNLNEFFPALYLLFLEEVHQILIQQPT